ncbi:Ig-like domain repeat protein [Methanobrevibacter sp.]|uniref:Ig-like domain repeat protein n=1 Tax=Methanobrevibacter sp. TaxID=66852 RepID=UPI00386E342D
MKNLKRISFICLILIASIILVSAVSATEDTTDSESLNEINDMETLEIDNSDSISIDENDALSSDNHKEGEGYIEFDKDSYEIEEQKQDTKITGTVYYYDENFGEYDSYWIDININCSYTDGNGTQRSYTTKVSNGNLIFDLNQCEGLVASDSPYNLTFRPVNDTLYETYVGENYDKPLVDSWVTLTVTPSQNDPGEINEEEGIIYVDPDSGKDENGYGLKNKPYKTIKYAVSQAEDNYTIYLYEGRYDENSITLRKSLSIIGENRNVIITSSVTNRKIFDSPYDSNGNHVNLRFENLTFDGIKSGQYNAILYLRNEDKNEIINCVFENNDGERNIWSASSETLIENCEFRNCGYTSAGNIIYLSGKGTQNITNVTFKGISNSGSGVVTLINIMNRPTIANINNITIKDSYGILNGISDAGSGNLPNSINIQNAIFENNEFRKTSNNQGGSLFSIASHSELEISNSTIINNDISRGVFVGGNGTKITANYNLICGNGGDILVSTVSSAPVTDYDMNYNYWGSENPDLGDLVVDVIATNDKFTEIKVIGSKLDPTMNINVANDTIFEGSALTIEVILDETATGNITIIGLGNIEPQQLENGKTTFTIANLLPNQYTIVLNYSGDDNYNNKTNETTITVKEKLNATINVNPVEIYEGENATITITLNEELTGDLTISNNNTTISTVILPQNNVNISIGDLTVGKHTITIIYSGDAKYKSLTTTTIVNVLENATTGNITGNETGNATGNETGNNTGNITGNETGNATGNETGNNTGNITGGETNNETGKTTNPVTEDSLKITKNEENKTQTISIELPDDATGTLTVNIDGIEYTQTLVNGKAAVTIRALVSGLHNIVVTYSGDDKYTSISKKTTIGVAEPAKTTTKKVASKITAKNKTFKAKTKVKKYTITLKAGKKLIKNVKVTLKINGKTYTTKTNSKGKATFKIKKLTKKGKYTAVIKFKGNKTYKATNKKVRITIKK